MCVVTHHIFASRAPFYSCQTAKDKLVELNRMADREQEAAEMQKEREDSQDDHLSDAKPSDEPTAQTSDADEPPAKQQRMWKRVVFA